MDLPDCPPGAEGYEDTVVEVPRKPDEPVCTKAEQEFQEHIASLKIHVEDGTTRCMVERRGRDFAGKWIYLCYPCAAFCSGETILQTHISGKKHKNKLALKNLWPVSIFEQHPYILGERGEAINKNKTANEGVSAPVTKKMAEEVELHNKSPSELSLKYNKYMNTTCHLQDTLDKVKTPLVGLEYLIEHPPEEAHHEPSYLCTLCGKQGHPRTIINHLTCFWHRYAYMMRHFTKACSLLTPYRTQPRCREGVAIILSRLAQRVEDKYGRLRPINIDKTEYENEKEQISQWLFKGFHFSEQPGATFEEVVDEDLINSLANDGVDDVKNNYRERVVNDKIRAIKDTVRKRDPSPPVVAAPTKPRGGERARRPSAGSLSDVSLEDAPAPDERRGPHSTREHNSQSRRYEPYPTKKPPHRPWYEKKKHPDEPTEKEMKRELEKRSYKEKLARETQEKLELSSRKMLAYHEKNPEKHPLYPEEWKKFWNRRYKEIQAEGKDPSKHDFKPEWIVYWTARMKELHDEELKVHVNEFYRKLCLTPPELARREERREAGRAEPRWSPRRRRSPDSRRRSPEPRKRSPEHRRRSPEPRKRSPARRRSPAPRRPEHRPPAGDYRRDHKSPGPRGSPPRRSADRRGSREPRRDTARSRSPVRPRRSPARTHITLESTRRSRSPLSMRAAAVLRNNSPAPALQTVLVSDDELKPDDGLSPWNSDKSLDSLGSLPDARSPLHRPRSRTASEASRASKRMPYSRPADPQDLGPPENIVATLRLLVALEDYLGSIGPKIVDLLTEALKMEKERANSSEELLVRDSAVVLIETAKEKLKGAAQAGLVAGGAAAAARAAVLRAAATLHAADARARLQLRQKKEQPSKDTAMPVAGVGEVDRAQIAEQMAAALIAQGKTDVSSEELAQLVEAVVGMAEAKKREAAERSRVAERGSEKAKASGTATALQMLQSAYDEHDKRIDEVSTDAMDGLSDSDLETLLKNFNELSAEEQHSLIAYLKKLEARSPQRVERLRQYVSAAASGPGSGLAAADPDPGPAQRLPDGASDPKLAPVTIESDDDDYTVEEVFKSATEKVKENQIRQEMEIVKKSLEESKAPLRLQIAENPKPAPKEVIPTVDLTAKFSSASDLFALVQASIQSTAKGTPPASEIADVVPSSSQPRSFGDRTGTTSGQPRPLLPNPSMPSQQFGNQQGGLLRTLTNIQTRTNDSYNNDTWSNQAQGNVQENRSFMSDNRDPMQDNRGPFIQDNRGTMHGGHMQGNMHGGGMQDNRGHMQGSHMQDNRGLLQDSRGPVQGGSYMQGNRPFMQDNRGQNMQNRPPFMSGPPARPQGNFGSDNYNQGPRGNFMNGRMQDNYDTRPIDMNQQQNNFRGRGRGHFGGPRGRGRGYY